MGLVHLKQIKDGIDVEVALKYLNDLYKHVTVSGDQLYIDDLASATLNGWGNNKSYGKTVKDTYICNVATVKSGNLNVLKIQKGNGTWSTLSSVPIGVSGVKGSSETTYRTGVVNITKANIGLEDVDNTADSIKAVATAVKWASPVTISLGGDVSGTVSLDGSTSKVSGNVEVSFPAVFKSIDVTSEEYKNNIGDYQSTITSDGTNISVKGVGYDTWVDTVNTLPAGSTVIGDFFAITESGFYRAPSGTKMINDPGCATMYTPSKNAGRYFFVYNVPSINLGIVQMFRYGTDETYYNMFRSPDYAHGTGYKLQRKWYRYLTQNVSDKQIRLDAGDWIGNGNYPFFKVVNQQSSTAGFNMQFGGGQNVVLGSGESYKYMYDYGLISTLNNEDLYLTSDKNVIVKTNMNSVKSSDDTVHHTFTFNTSGAFKAPIVNASHLNGAITTNYFVCDSEASLTEKILTNTTFKTLTPGTIICVRFTKGNTAQQFSININNTGAKNVKTWDSSSTLKEQMGLVNRTYTLVYGNGAWILITPDKVATSTQSLSDAEGSKEVADTIEGNIITGGLVVKSFSCTTVAATAEKVLTDSKYNVKSIDRGALIVVQFKNANTADSATLNINNSGAKSIYTFESTAVTAKEMSRKNYSYFFVYGGSVWHLLNPDKVDMTKTHGILAVANGGTGQTNLSNVTVGKANTLATARTISLKGAVWGSTTFDGSKNVTINTSMNQEEAFLSENITSAKHATMHGYNSSQASLFADYNMLWYPGLWRINEFDSDTLDSFSWKNHPGWTGTTYLVVYKSGSSNKIIQQAYHYKGDRVVVRSCDKPAAATINAAKANGTVPAVTTTPWHNIYPPPVNIVAGASTGTVAAATTNGNTYLKVTSDADLLGKVKISGAGGTSVTSDASGNIVVTGATTISSAAKLNTARSIVLQGAVTGSTSFDGSKNVTITTSAVQDNVFDAQDISAISNATSYSSLIANVNTGGIYRIDGKYYKDGIKHATSSKISYMQVLRKSVASNASIIQLYYPIWENSMWFRTVPNGDTSNSPWQKVLTAKDGNTVSLPGNTTISGDLKVTGNIVGNMGAGNIDLKIGASNTTTSAATTNGKTYLKLVKDNAVASKYKIIGSGLTKVTSDSSGNITINTPVQESQNITLNNDVMIYNMSGHPVLQNYYHVSDTNGDITRLASEHGLILGSGEGHDHYAQSSLVMKSKKVAAECVYILADSEVRIATNLDQLKYDSTNDSLSATPLISRFDTKGGLNLPGTLTAAGVNGTLVGAALTHNHAASNITSGVLSIARGGTGASTAAAARTSLGAAAASHTHVASDIASGTLPAARGGTGQTDLNKVTVGKANTLSTARTITLTGAIWGSTTFDGSKNVTINTLMNQKEAFLSVNATGKMMYDDMVAANRTYSLPAYSATSSLQSENGYDLNYMLNPGFYRADFFSVNGTSYGWGNNPYSVGYSTSYIQVLKSGSSRWLQQLLFSYTGGSFYYRGIQAPSSTDEGTYNDWHRIWPPKLPLSKPDNDDGSIWIQT